jgi:hypothetical protein
MKRVLIATPCLDGKVDAYYVHSLCESIKLGLKHNLAINAIFLANESILPMARNELLNVAYLQQYDAMVFIDDDEYWDHKALIDILLSEKEVVALPVVNKGDKKIEFNVFTDSNTQQDLEDGFISVTKVGTGFLKLEKQVIVDLWESNPEITFRSKTLKLICDYGTINGGFVGEDITLCRKIRELGYKIWVNPKHTVAHMGVKMYKGDFEKQYNEKHSIL